ncbi:MAG: hypothetical protein ACLTSG_12480 [Lachnospiraceae bacterium]
MLSGGAKTAPRLHLDDGAARRAVHTSPLLRLPCTSGPAKEKVVELARLLRRPGAGRCASRSCPSRAHTGGDPRQDARRSTFTLVMRRFHDAHSGKAMAERGGCKAIVTGENLGQVASQTMEAMASTQAVTEPCPSSSRL